LSIIYLPNLSIDDESLENACFSASFFFKNLFIERLDDLLNDFIVSNRRRFMKLVSVFDLDQGKWIGGCL